MTRPAFIITDETPDSRPKELGLVFGKAAIPYHSENVTEKLSKAIRSAARNSYPDAEGVMRLQVTPIHSPRSILFPTLSDREVFFTGMAFKNPAP